MLDTFHFFLTCHRWGIGNREQNSVPEREFLRSVFYKLFCLPTYKTNFMNETTSSKQQLLKEIEQIPEPFLSQLLDFALFLKEKYVEEDISQEEEENIAAAKSAYDAGDYLTLEEYEAQQG